MTISNSTKGAVSFVTPTYLLVEYTIVLVDIRNISLFLIESLAGELALLVNAAKNCQYDETPKNETTYSLLILLTILSIASSEGLLSP